MDVSHINQANIEQLRMQQQMDALEVNAKQFLSKDAVLRFGNIKAVNPELALKIAALIVQLVQAGQLDGQINDEKFKELLRHLQGAKREFNFKGI